jgi:PKD repeat protein
MKKKVKYLLFCSLAFSIFLMSNVLANFDFTMKFNSNSILERNEAKTSEYQSCDSGSSDYCPDCDSDSSNDCPDCDSTSNNDCPDCETYASARASSCSADCLTIIPASAEYISYKRSTDSLFEDLFNFANELGFTECIGKYLVYKKNTSEFIGFMGLRVNEDLSDKIALFSFESSPLNTVLVQFSISSDNITTFSIFDRTSRIDISNGITLFSNGIFETSENLDWGAIALIESLTFFLEYRFTSTKCSCDELTIVNSIQLNETEFIESLNNPDMYAYAVELGYLTFELANKTIFKNGEEVIFGILKDANNQLIVLMDTVNKSCLMNITINDNSISTITLFTRVKGVILNLTDLSILEEWGTEFHSCSYDRCFWACILDFLASPGGLVCLVLCEIACLTYTPACIACIGVCSAIALILCNEDCTNDPCSHGHECHPGVRVNVRCYDWRTIEYKICDSDGLGWTTHYDYCPSGHYCDPTTLQCLPIPPPQASIFLITPLPLYDSMTICFSSEGSVDDDGYIVSYDWDFGDGTSSTETNPCHQFCAGSYTVTLTVTDNDGNTASASIDILVHDDDTSPPVITITYHGEKTDGSPGYWDVQVSDAQSGLYVLLVSVDGIYKGCTSGHYNVPTSLGSHVISVYAKNNDRDKDGCNDQEDDTKTDAVNIVDDDISAPKLTLKHIGNLFDGDPGHLEFSIIEEDPGSDATGTLTIQGPYFSWSHNYGEGAVSLNLKNIGVCELGTYNVILYAENNDEDRGGIDEESDDIDISFSLTDDDIDPPIITVNYNEDYNWDITGTKVNFTFTVSAYDESGFSSIYITIGDYTANFLGYHEAILDEGIYNLIVTIWDDDNDRFWELDMLSSTKIIEDIILDLTPPETNIFIDPYYDDGAGNYYVTHLTNFWFETTDNVAGVDYTKYRILGLTEWLPAETFTLEGCPDGIYTIEFYSADQVGNIEDLQSINVVLVSIDVESYIIRGQSEIINYFDVIFRKCKQDGTEGFMLVATNPGEIFYNIEIINDWPITVGTLSIDATLPVDFIMKGANPIHIFLDGTEITNLCDIDGSIITVYNLPPGSKVKVIVHVDYNLKGMFYPTLDEFWMENYNFYTIIQSFSGMPGQPAGELRGTYDSVFNFKAYEKKVTAIAGFLKDEYGNPIANALIELRLPDGSIVTTTSNSEGLYYFINLEVDQYEIRFINNGIPSAWIMLETLKDEVLWMDIIL